MRILIRLALCLAVSFCLASVSLAAAQEVAQEAKRSAGGCHAQLSGIYGTISYADNGVVTEKSEGDFKLWVCQGLYFTFDGGGAQEASEVFENLSQLEWFVSDLTFIAVNFSPPADEYVGEIDHKFTLYPHKDDLDHRPAHLLLRAVDMLPAGIALKFEGSNTLRFFYFKNISSLSFSNGGPPG